MVLVAVGADYSMLFASRIREEARTSMTRSIIRAFGTTGSVITTAGIVFAITMFALMSGSVVLLIQVGFTVGVGLILDVAIVRTLLVPAAMHLLGDRVWWPVIPRRHERRQSASDMPLTQAPKTPM
ncbi:MMPL family protein [Williamsia maris]|uniref:MMPL family protein n=1 Tax=Williamsia maris TaxID=72806 RepID=A0ABT1HJF8_9NOCA|nr:MMPL family protein [Williamsia maris]